TVEKRLKLMFTPLAVTIAASFGTLPLMLLHFNRLSMVGIIANLAIEPIICLFSLPLGFVSVLLMYLAPQLSGLILGIGAVGLDLSTAIALFLSDPNFTQLWLPAPGTSLCFLYYLSLGLILLARQSAKGMILGATGFVAALIGFYLPLSDLSRTSLPSTRISILAVGHGSANVLELRNGRVVLVDGGSNSRPGYDCGSRIIAPFLWSQKIAKVDDIFLTHDDADHYSGIASVIERFDPDRLWIPGKYFPKKGFEQLLVQDTQLRGADYHSAADDNGLVVKFNAAQTTILFPGDITTNREQKLIAKTEKLKSDILLSPHHGSSTSNSDEFLAAVAPDIIIFSNGRNRNGLFPAREVMARVRFLGIAPLETATQGTIAITIGAEHDSIPVYRISAYNISAQTHWRRG
ncbi:MAG: ComEC/Rec2 family competence protein, partial [Desulfofustis sp.]